MSVVLAILLLAVCLQGLVKFALGFLVPYSTRIRRIAAYYERGGRVIAVYDNVTLVVLVGLVALLAISGMDHLSFVTGLVVGMLVIQVFFHRFHEPLPADRAPAAPAPPVKVMSYAIQAKPELAWREIAVMIVLFVWSGYLLVRGLLGT